MNQYHPYRGVNSRVTMSDHVNSYYAATANPYHSHPELAGEVTADVCVIGAGFTGISAALHLAEAGMDVVLLEAERVGWGASGRNGGQICSAFNQSMEEIEKLVGKEGAAAMWEVDCQSKDLIRDRVTRHNIDCDLQWGYLHAASKASHMKGMQETIDEWARYGYDDTELLDKQSLKDRLDSDIYHGGMWEANAGHLHPLNYALGLAKAAEEAGVKFFEQSRVTSINTDKDISVRTARGLVTAKFLVAAGNAYLEDLIKPLYHRVMPVKSFILATEPLGDNVAKGLVPNNDAIVDSNNICNYFRLSGDGRMLFGGRANYSGMEPKDLFSYMKPRMLKVFPQLKDVALDYCWGGTLAITADRLPHVGQIDGKIFFAHGFSGHGVAHSGMCGKLMAEAIQGNAEKFDVMAKIRHQPFPGGPIRMPLLALGMLYYKMRDLLS